MNFLDDLDENIARAEKYLAKAEYAREQGWATAYEVSITAVAAILKVTRHCVECAKRQQDILGHHRKFECEGGCVRGTGIERFSENNKRLWYVMNWTRRHDPRYKEGK